MSFPFLLEKQRTGGWNRTCLGAVGTSRGWGGGERAWEGEYGANTAHTWM
jgi:hypothetical protein